MSVTLVGGGFSAETDAVVFAPFVADARARAERMARASDSAGGTLAGEEPRTPRIAVITVREPDDLTRHGRDLAAAIGRAGAVETIITALREGDVLSPDVLDDVDGVVLGGGLTPAYREAIAPVASRIRRLVEDGVPYLGFSAGAMIAPDRALLGGWQIGGVEVSPEEGAEELDEVTIEEGIGLLDVTVDVHAAQWGNLSRLLAAVDADLIDGGIAIDERTALVLETGRLRSVGAGNVWLVTRTDDGVRVRTLVADREG